ncbi:MAG TPA: hypothetical protein VKX49_04340 [Bryobacteraceae bacterium]|nr:hypothetical protein [Bryobacteraceae bacterium]
MPTKHADPGTFDTEHRLFLPTWEVFNQTKYDALEKWIAANASAFGWLLANLDTLKRNRRGYCSGSRIRSALRDRYPAIIKVDEFAFNNNLTKYLKYRIVFLRPELHLFEFRRQERAEPAPICPRHHCKLICPQCVASKQT